MPPGNPHHTNNTHVPARLLTQECSFSILWPVQPAPAALCHLFCLPSCSYKLAENGERITAYFKPSDSSSSVPSSDGNTFSRTDTAPGIAVEAQLLVASDGYFSRVRKQCVNDGPPQVWTL